MRKYNWDEYGLPEYMYDGFTRYYEHGVDPGGFMFAVLTNNLESAVGHADHVNMHLLPNYVKFLYNEVAASSWGSREAVEYWIKTRREQAKNHDRKIE